MNANNSDWLLFLKASDSIRGAVFSKLDKPVLNELRKELDSVPKVPLSLLREALISNKVPESPEITLETPERQKMVKILDYLVSSNCFNVQSVSEAYVAYTSFSTSSKRALETLITQNN
ncbi:hypothetical protein F7Q91_22565 [Vibrio chagasii]|uniref:Uncharacterized protein n=1 Tax=Vibrio chagasii TaxID=170679 RepID=A0A7V7NQ24_9VIBR|nr:hypothetical protein [Vibrio chagasii]KAB0470279.1 hypothetical protein F7Q91_22565 [Vibrio chagasii]